MKKNYKVYGTVNNIEYLLGTITSEGNALIFAKAMSLSYLNVRVE